MIPPLARARAVVTIHDIIHVLYPQFLPNRAARRKAARTGTQIRMRVEHENDCPAIDKTLDAAIRRWQR